jgi:hypothetical protein
MSTSETARRVSDFAQLATELAGAADEDTRLQVAVNAALGLVDGCDHAGITINMRHGLVTLVSTDDVVQRANELQHELGEGPCLDVLRDQETLISPDLELEQRWSVWAKRAHVELGVGSMMSLLLYTAPHSYGALSLYAQEDHRFDADDVVIGQALAAHISVIATAERQIDQLGAAMDNRTIIGRAQGTLMERLGIGADQSFDYLRRVSSHTNRKLVDVAREIDDTRRLPDLG